MRRAVPALGEDTIHRGKREQTIANVGLVVGALGAGAAVLFVVLDRRADGREVAVVPGWSSVALRGTF